jgi:Spy/CpxP family protein refolding chaperone
MNTARTLAALALGLGLAVPAAASELPDAAPAAQDGIVVAQAAPVPGPQAPGQYRQTQRHGRYRHMGHRRMPTYAGIALRHQAELGLNPQQVDGLQKLQTDSMRTSIQRRADLQIAGLDLMTLRRADPVDLSKVEAKVRDIEKMRADGQIARIRTDEQGKAQLTADQRAKLKSLMMARWQQWRERQQRRSDSDGPARPAVLEERT